MGDGPKGRDLSPPPTALGDPAAMHDVTPALMFRIASVGIAGTQMAGWSSVLSPDQRWDVIAYVNSLRATEAQVLQGEGLFAQRCAGCHGVLGASDGALSRALASCAPSWGFLMRSARVMKASA